MNLSDLITQYVTPARLNMVLRVMLILAIGIPAIILIKRLAHRLTKDRLSPQSEQLVVRVAYYSSVLILFMSVLNEFGFKLSALLGAAGIFGIAIGFASQTSVSNIISGIFLISEKPFVVGDTIQVGKSTGVIQSIDLLSVKLRTAENCFVRVPNEIMIKTEVINHTRFPIHRVNIKVPVSYSDDLRDVVNILKEIAATEPLALQEPPAIVNIENFADASIELLFGVWGHTQQSSLLRSALMISIKEGFDAQHIESLAPHESLDAGNIAEPTK